MKSLKRITGLFLALGLCVSLAACGGGDDVTDDISNSESAASDSSEETTGSKASSEEETPTSTLFDDPGVQALLTSEYDSPQEIDLYEMFYNGAMDEGYETAQGVTLDQGSELSEEEKTLLVEAGYQDDLDFIRVRREDMDSILRFRTGCGLDEMDGVGLEKLVFLEDYDAYYYCHSDTNFLTDLALMEQHDNEDGSVTYCYTSMEYDGELTFDAETGYVLSNRYTVEH